MSPQHKIATRVPSGHTLIEITVVITIIVLLISALFLSANYYKRGANRAGCVTNISSIHKIIRSYQNFEALSTGDPIDLSQLFNPENGLQELPMCPQSHGTYIISETILDPGNPMATCEDYNPATGAINPSYAHAADSSNSW